MPKSNQLQTATTEPIAANWLIVGHDVSGKSEMGDGWEGSKDMSRANSEEDTCSELETVARMDATLKRMLATPHKPHKDSKVGRRESQSK